MLDYPGLRGAAGRLAVDGCVGHPSISRADRPRGCGRKLLVCVCVIKMAARRACGC